MFRKLLIVFASGVILSIVAFGAAWAIGGDAIRKDFGEGHGWHWSNDEDDHGPQKTRSFAVDPGSQIAMGIPVELHFNRGDQAGMTVTGPASVIDHLVWINGRLSTDGKVRVHHGVRVQITAPQITGLDLDAPGEVTLAGLDQESLRLHSRGAIDLDASGKVNRMFVTSEGAGDIDLGHVEGKDATVRVEGVGDVTIGASGTVDVQIDGAGNVTLLRKPAVLRSRIHGIGNIDHDY